MTLPLDGRLRMVPAALAFALLAASTAFAQTPAAPPDVAAPPADAERTPTGLASRMLTPGVGEQRASDTDLVDIHFTLWTSDGRMLESTSGGAAARFPLERAFPGLRECVSLMTVEETRRCWVPEKLAYKGQEDRPKGMLVVDVELLAAEVSPTIPPPDVSAPPDNARATESGLKYRVLQQGIGARRPYAGGAVTVHYTGWTTEGEMFDSSVLRGQPTSFGLDQVITGWSEAVQLMVQGEKTRFWIPEELAYADGGGPSGMLVFDIELLSIDR